MKMNKKINTVLFVLGATLFNILVTMLAFFLLLTLYYRFIMQHLPSGAQAWSFPLIFIASIAISYVIYHFTVKLLLKKIEMEKYFDPVFTGRRRHR
jgi:hypothetical protein